MAVPSPCSLEEEHLEFSRNHFLAMPITGTIAWTIIAIDGIFVPTGLAHGFYSFVQAAYLGLVC